MAKAEVDFQSDGTAVLKALKAIEGGMDSIVKMASKVEESTKRNESLTREFSDSAERGFRGQLRTLGQIAASWLSIQTATRLAWQEYDKYKSRMEQSAATADVFNRNIGMAMQNAPSSMSRPDVEQMARNISRAAGVTPTEASAMLGPMMGMAGSNISAGQFEQIGSIAAKLAPYGGEDQVETAKAIASFVNRLPKGSKISVEQVAGSLIQSSRESSIDRLKFYFPEASKIQASALSYGLDTGESLAMLNAISRGIGDTEGAISRTQTANILERLADVRKSRRLDTNRPSEIIDYILKNPVLAKQVNKDIQARAITEGFTQSLFSDLSGVGQQFWQDALRNTPRYEGAEATLASQVSRIGGSSLAASGRAGQALASAAESNLLDPKTAERAIIRSTLERFYASGDSLAASDKINMAEYDAATAMGENPTQFVRSRLSRQINRLRSSTPAVFYGAEGYEPAQEPSREDLERARRIEMLLEQLVANTQPTGPGIQPNGDRPLNPYSFNPAGVLGGRVVGAVVDAFRRPGQY